MLPAFKRKLTKTDSFASIKWHYLCNDPLCCVVQDKPASCNEATIQEECGLPGGEEVEACCVPVSVENIIGDEAGAELGDKEGAELQAEGGGSPPARAILGGGRGDGCDGGPRHHDCALGQSPWPRDDHRPWRVHGNPATEYWRH